MDDAPVKPAVEGYGEIPRSSPRPAGWLDLLAAALLLGLTFGLYHAALGFFWQADDFYNLRFSSHHTPLQVLLSAKTWAELPFKMVTPLLFHSFQLDLALAGTSSFAFYFHQLLAVALSAVALYTVLRLWIGPGPSTAGACLYLLGAPTGGLAATLMVRQYPEAIALLLFAAFAWTLSLRGRGQRSFHPGWGLVSVGLYAVACLAKEIAVPLPFAVLLLPEGTLRQRLRATAPMALTLGLYLIYRRYLIGTWLGGYGWVVEAEQWPRLALALPFKVANQLAGAGGFFAWGLVGLVLFAAVLSSALARRPLEAAARWLAALALVLLPILPVSFEMTSRYAALPWMLVSAAAALGGARAWGSVSISRSLRLLLLVALGGVAVLAWRSSWEKTRELAERASSENRAFLELGESDLLFRPSSYPASMVELALFRAETRGGSPGITGDHSPSWAYDELSICDPPTAARLWEYNPSTSQVVEITRTLPAHCAAWKARLRPAAALEASFLSNGTELSWQLGPYEEGSYALVVDNSKALFAVPRRGAFRRGNEPLRFRLRYESPEGWITYSPEIGGAFGSQPKLDWRRP
jgi:hypothetical protein